MNESREDDFQSVGEVTDDELRKLIEQDRTFATEEADETDDPLKGPKNIEDDAFAGTLFEIDDLVTLAIADSTKLPAFKIDGQIGSKKVVAGSRFEQYFRLLDIFEHEFSDHLEYSPKVALFYDCYAELGFRGVYPKNLNAPLVSHSAIVLPGTIQAELFNDLVGRVRSEYKANNISRKITKRKYAGNRFYGECVKYIDAIYEHVTTRLAVVRIDLGYKRDLAANISVEVAREDFKRFISMRDGKRKIFDHEVGYIWKLEYSRLKRFHYHLMLFFDGNKVKNHSYHAEQVGHYWRDSVTKGKGTYFNCNRNPNRYKRCGIGRVDYNDKIKRGNMLFALSYLTKSEQYLMVKVGKKQHTMDKGEMPVPRTSKAGRPRRT